MLLSFLPPRHDLSFQRVVWERNGANGLFTRPIRAQNGWQARNPLRARLCAYGTQTDCTLPSTLKPRSSVGRAASVSSKHLMLDQGPSRTFKNSLERLMKMEGGRSRSASSTTLQGQQGREELGEWVSQNGAPLVTKPWENRSASAPPMKGKSLLFRASHYRRAVFGYACGPQQLSRHFLVLLGAGFPALMAVRTARSAMISSLPP